MRIGSRDTDDAVVVVAEIGNNHEGDLKLAKELVRLAAASGADAVKFQTIEPELLVSVSESARVQQLRRFALCGSAWAELATVAHAAGVEFLSTPFSLRSVTILEPHVAAYKVASGDNDFWPLLERVAATGRPVIVSTGLADHAHCHRIVDLFHRAWEGPGPGLALLHCVVAYPTPDDQANIQAVSHLAELGITPGYSDHTIGSDAAVLAVALGARVVEKHFTIAHDYSDFRDHRLSADPSELAVLSSRIREVERRLGEGNRGVAVSGLDPDRAQVLLGDGHRPIEVEEPNRSAVRRGLAVSHDLEAGHVLTREDLTWVRPQTGLAPGQEHLVLGRPLKRAVRAGDFISLDLVGG